MTNQLVRLFSTAAVLGLSAGYAISDVVHLDDVIVDGSLCVGFDCVNGESFGFDTIRLKENNLRIKFDDTSAAANFPNNDWQITANASTNGGANKFSIDDITNSRTPFTVEALAPSHSLYVDDGGRIGNGTSTPSVDLHTVSGNTPTLRLAQDGSSGFAPQTWDVAGNETSFFIRDTSNGSTLPFRIRPGAPSQALVIDNDGDVGVGILSPTAALHVSASDDAKLLLKNTSTTQASRDMLQLENNGGSYITISNTQSGRDWFFTHENNVSGRFIINSSTNPADGLFLDPDGDMTIGGTLTENSDKHAKMAIVPVNEAEILDKVATLPVSAWTYKDDTSGARHVGPMAQDFYAAFGLGHTDKGIATLDTSGIALASIKALHDELEQAHSSLSQQDERIAKQDARIAELMATVGSLQKQMARD
jgi:hypothetical protein